MVVVTLQDDGRIELPDTIRESLGLYPGARLALEQVDDDRTLQLRALPDTVQLVEKDGVWVIRRQSHSVEEGEEDPVAKSREERLASFFWNNE